MDTSDIDEMFSALGPVTVKRMFGGQGIYHRGLIVAVVFKGEVLLKADAASAPDFAAAGARRWTYEGRTGKPVEMPYWSVPESALRRPRRDGALGAGRVAGGDAGGRRYCGPDAKRGGPAAAPRRGDLNVVVQTITSSPSSRRRSRTSGRCRSAPW